jgi:hypothetical protein
MLAIDSVVSSNALEVHVAFFQVVCFGFSIGRTVNDANFIGAIYLDGATEEVPKHVGDCASVVFTCVPVHVRLVG